MPLKKIAEWIGYWDRASGPRIDRVQSLADLVICRRYNACMNGGVMWDVSDAEMWDALVFYRAQQKAA